MPRNQHKPKIEEKLQTLANLLPLSKFGIRATVEIAPMDSRTNETYLLEYGRLGLCLPDIYQMVDSLRSAHLIIGEEHHDPSDAVTANKQIGLNKPIYIGDNLKIRINSAGNFALEFVPIGEADKVLENLDHAIKNITKNHQPNDKHKKDWRLNLEAQEIMSQIHAKYRTV